MSESVDKSILVVIDKLEELGVSSHVGFDFVLFVCESNAVGKVREGERSIYG